ncbi:hypothetical protein SAMN02800692_0209 [Luteibacter sp. UNC138MFCol5.1]|uniref:universal stress protein n=1 Tax=Luteibacter sp. UNC138MFCol5.1 TaxID=1502774 RepID=UPI0008B895F9|nr:universal stress protein [Luteibacter sp. UNC138MFCol5.1]SEO31943.1 hypothetical protein SAMN02800692_0209 [Luteibacter sp. UNC138MFCol5.1]
MTESTAHETVEASQHVVGHAFRDIAVALTGVPGDSSAFEAAVDLARHFGSRLELLQMLLMPTPFVDAWSLVPDASFYQVYDDMRQLARKESEAWRGKLAAQRVEGDVRVLEALYIEPSALAAHAARTTDLVVLSLPFRAPIDTSVVHAYFSGLLAGAGRPVLVVPSTSTATLPPRRAMVAWTDAPEAARAVNDALPLLRGCDAVDIVSVRRDPAVPPAGRRLDDLCRHLRRHGVDARSLVVDPGESTVAATLLSHASRTRAQLLVSGGYGHSRLREWAAGGVTRELFLDAPIPILFSH